MSHRDDANAVDAEKPLARGHNHYRVEMWFAGSRIGICLVRNCWGERTARRAALKGIATVVMPMSDVDQVRWLTNRETKP